jgi:hypothetical protein
MKTIAIVATLALAAASLAALGCGGDKSASSTGAAATGAASQAATAAAAATAMPGGKPGVVATCNKKGICTEYHNTIPDLSEDLCKGTDGTFAKGSTPCTTEKLLGTCVNKLTPDTTTFWYGGADELDVDKGICEALDGKWTVPAAASAAPSAASSAAAPATKMPGKATPGRKKR